MISLIGPLVMSVLENSMVIQKLILKKAFILNKSRVVGELLSLPICKRFRGKKLISHFLFSLIPRSLYLSQLILFEADNENALFYHRYLQT